MPSICPKKRLNVVSPMDQSLVVKISSAQNEIDRVKFTIHTKTTLPEFAKSDFSIVRYHEDFLWLHECLQESEHYAGYIIPSAPHSPEFDSSIEKTDKLREGEDTTMKEEHSNMKQEVKSVYLATFKKTVATHDTFLQRIANHAVFRNDENFRIFLECDQEIPVRVKNKKEMFVGLISNIGKSADGFLLSHAQNDTDEFFLQEKHIVTQYHSHIKDASLKSDKIIKRRKKSTQSYTEMSTAFAQLATSDVPELQKLLFGTLSETFEKSRNVESRLASDEDLILSDHLKYFKKESSAAKHLINRRLKYLSDYVAATSDLAKAEACEKDVDAAKDTEEDARQKFEVISEQAKPELQDFNTRKIVSFQKNLLGLIEYELKHSKEQTQLLKSCISSLRKAKRSQDAQQ